ncbi:MAG: hypothetical protein HQL37_09690 [Alphaproteobacteria bacterium]|nr:hypothetical protein [Alphaproteobacteria bacterium]
MTTDAFLAYGDATAPTFRPTTVRAATPISPAIKRDQERRKLSVLARQQLRAEERTILACPEGPRLAAMLKWMRSLAIDQGEEFLEVLAGEDWLLTAPEAFRRVAQRLFGRVTGHIRRRAGFDALDDPLPWDEDGLPVESLHGRIKQLLNLR